MCIRIYGHNLIDLSAPLVSKYTQPISAQLSDVISDDLGLKLYSRGVYNKLGCIYPGLHNNAQAMGFRTRLPNC